jgi:hypothetical protein
MDVCADTYFTCFVKQSGSTVFQRVLIVTVANLQGEAVECERLKRLGSEERLLRQYFVLLYCLLYQYKSTKYCDWVARNVSCVSILYFCTGCPGKASMLSIVTVATVAASVFVLLYQQHTHTHTQEAASVFVLL